MLRVLILTSNSIMEGFFILFIWFLLFPSNSRISSEDFILKHHQYGAILYGEIALESSFHQNLQERRRWKGQCYVGSGLAGYAGVGLCPTPRSKSVKWPAGTRSVKENGTEGNVKHGTRITRSILEPTTCRKSSTLHRNLSKPPSPPSLKVILPCSKSAPKLL